MELQNKKRFDAVVIVEGRDDTKRLKQYFPGIETIETNGSEVSQQTITTIVNIAKKRDVIIFTDPDFNGERIRKIILKAVPTAKQAFITRKEGEPTKRGNSLGVEHASKAALQRALSDLHEVDIKANAISIRQYDELGLGMGDNARKLREKVGIALGVGYGNAKQFYKRLAMFGISYNKLKEVVKHVK